MRLHRPTPPSHQFNQDQVDKTVWRRLGLIAILLPVCLFFPLALFVVGFLVWSIREHLKPPEHPILPPPRTWRNATPEDDDWLTLFCEGCESPAEEQFLRAMVKEFDLRPDNGKLKSPNLTLDMQVEDGDYRYDFLANGRQVIEVDGAAWHSSTEQMERDRIRDEYAVQGGYKVLRIPAVVVLKTPDEAIRRVKETIADTRADPRNTAPPIWKKRTITGYFHAFVCGLEKIDRRVEIARQTQEATAGFKSAINTEQMLLDMLVERTEFDQRVERMSPEERTSYDAVLTQMRELFADEEKPSSDVFRWQKIVQPALQEDREIQERVQAAFESAMEERNTRLAELKERCAKDPVFTRLLCRKMMDAGYPAENAMKIVPRSLYIEAYRESLRTLSGNLQTKRNKTLVNGTISRHLSSTNPGSIRS